MANAVSRASNVGVGLLAAGAAAIGLAYAAPIATGTAPTWAPWLLAFGGAACMVGLFVVGAASRGPVRPFVGWLLTALFVVIFAAFGTALSMPVPPAGTEAIVLGLPKRLAIVFYGIGVLPLVILPVVFAMSLGKDQQK
jgi:hypothetical protein